MKIKIIRSKFIDGLKKVQNIVAGKGSLQIIQNAMLEAADGKLSLVTTDLDISIKSTVGCDVIEEGATTIPVKLLSSTITSCAEGVVELEVDAKDSARITAGSASFKLSGMSVVDFPKLPVSENSFAYTLPQSTLREMLRKTSYSVSQDETRKTLNGVLMSFKDGKLTMVATDGRRLALVEHEVEFPISAEKDIVLPSKVVAELQRSLSGDGDVKVKIEKSQVSFNLGDTQIYSKLVDAIYPNYRQVIPSNFKEKVDVDRRLLLDALDRASVMTMEESSSTRLTFDSNQLLVSSVATDIGEAKDVVPIKYSGEHIEIVFNPAYVKDPLKAIDDDEVTIELTSGTTPAVIRCSVPFLYVMMPLRIN